MRESILSLLIFVNGTVFGAILCAILRRRIEDDRIESALDTIGIKRKEFLKLDGQVSALQQTVAHNCNRLSFLEKSNGDLDRV